MKTAKRKNFITRAAIMITICILAVFSCSAAFADGDWVNVNGESRQVYWRTYGNGNEISIFHVVVYDAPATIYFEQEEGLCYEASHTHVFDGPMGKEEEWGKYHVYYRRADSNQTHCKEWDKTWHGDTFELYLNNTGIYYVWVVPYTAREVTDSWLLDTFHSWNRTPRWRVTGVTNGTRTEALPFELTMYGCNTDKRVNIYEIIR